MARRRYERAEHDENWVADLYPNPDAVFPAERIADWVLGVVEDIDDRVLPNLESEDEDVQEDAMIKLLGFTTELQKYMDDFDKLIPNLLVEEPD